MAAVAPITVAPGDHLCGFYYGDDERDALLVSFLRTGLLAGDNCLAVLDAPSPSDLVAGVTDADGVLTSGQLELYETAQTYLAGGSFDPDRMIAFWERKAEASAASGFSRVVGEMSWLERAPAARGDVLKYELWADGFAARFDHAILCMYDVSRLGSAILLDLMRTHPKLLLGGLILENPHHVAHEHAA